MIFDWTIPPIPPWALIADCAYSTPVGPTGCDRNVYPVVNFYSTGKECLTAARRIRNPHVSVRCSFKVRDAEEEHR